MEHARSHGFPAPAARALSETEIVMDRVEGRTMATEMMRRPWLIGSHAGVLAALHKRLGSIPAPTWLDAPLGAGDALLHLDLHPDNVIMSERGPIVIDWPNAARGPAAADIAHTWIVVACSLPPTGWYRQTMSRVGRRLFLTSFLSHFDRAPLLEQIEAAGRYRLANRTLPQSEHDAVRKLIGRLAPRPR